MGVHRAGAAVHRLESGQARQVGLPCCHSGIPPAIPPAQQALWGSLSSHFSWPPSAYLLAAPALLCSYLEWREALAAAALAASTAIDGMWEATTLGLNSDASLPAWSGSSLRNHAALLLMALRATGCNSVLFLSLGRPIRLWLHVPTSALALALVLHRVPAVCATAALQDPIAAGIIDQWHSSLSGLAQLNPVGAGHSAAASKCQLVLSTMQWVFVFVLPSLAVAALESSALHHFKSDLARRWSRCVSGSGGGAVGKASPHLPGQMDRKESVVVSAEEPRPCPLALISGAALLPVNQRSAENERWDCAYLGTWALEGKKSTINQVGVVAKTPRTGLPSS